MVISGQKKQKKKKEKQKLKLFNILMCINYVCYIMFC